MYASPLVPLGTNSFECSTCSNLSWSTCWIFVRGVCCARDVAQPADFMSYLDISHFDSC